MRREAHEERKKDKGEGKYDEEEDCVLKIDSLGGVQFAL